MQNTLDHERFKEPKKHTRVITHSATYKFIIYIFWPILSSFKIIKKSRPTIDNRERKNAFYTVQETFDREIVKKEEDQETTKPNIRRNTIQTANN